MSPTEPFTKELNYEPHGLSSQSDCGRRLSDTNQGGPGLSLQCLVGFLSRRVSDTNSYRDTLRSKWDVEVVLS